jgi:hypothetical protein
MRFPVRNNKQISFYFKRSLESQFGALAGKEANLAELKGSVLEQHKDGKLILTNLGEGDVCVVACGKTYHIRSRLEIDCPFYEFCHKDVNLPQVKDVNFDYEFEVIEKKLNSSKEKEKKANNKEKEEEKKGHKNHLEILFVVLLSAVITIGGVLFFLKYPILRNSQKVNKEDEKKDEKNEKNREGKESEKKITKK